jgi:hypothetical protein
MGIGFLPIPCFHSLPVGHWEKQQLRNAIFDAGISRENTSGTLKRGAASKYIVNVFLRIVAPPSGRLIFLL